MNRKQKKQLKELESFAKDIYTFSSSIREYCENNPGDTKVIDLLCKLAEHIYNRIIFLDYIFKNNSTEEVDMTKNKQYN